MAASLNVYGKSVTLLLMLSRETSKQLNCILVVTGMTLLNLTFPVQAAKALAVASDIHVVFFCVCVYEHNHR